MLSVTSSRMVRLGLAALLVGVSGCSQSASQAPQGLQVAAAAAGPGGSCTPVSSPFPLITAPPTSTPAPGPPLTTKAGTDIGLDGAIRLARAVASQFGDPGPLETVRACGPMVFNDASRLWGPSSIGLTAIQGNLPVYAVELKGNFTAPPINYPGPGAPPSSPPIATRGFVYTTDGNLIEVTWNGADGRAVQTGLISPPDQRVPQPVPSPTSSPGS